MAEHQAETHVIGGVDTHKDLHVAAVVDHRDRVLGTESFPTTRHGYRLMLAWMNSFGDLQRVGIECSGSYGAGLLRYMQAAGVEILEVTAPDKLDRRRRGKNDDFDAESAAHAAFAKRHTVTPRTRDGMVESLRVLRVCRKTATLARRTTSPGASQREIRSWKQSAASNATLPAKSSASLCDGTERSAKAKSPLDS